MTNNTALIIIDVQKGMFAEDDPVANGDAFLGVLIGLIEAARQSATPVIYIQHNGQGESVLRPDRPGWPIYPAVTPQDDEIVIRKLHSDSFQGTELQQLLQQFQIRNLVIAGIQTEYCVDTTCRRAYSLDYRVTLVRDGHTTWDTDLLPASKIIAHHNEVLGGSFVTLKTASEIQSSGFRSLSRVDNLA